MPDSWPHELQRFMLLCPLLSPGICSNCCPLNWWCLQPFHPIAQFSSCLQSFPSSLSFPMSRLSASGGQSNVLTPLVLFYFLRSPCYLLPQNLCTCSSLSGLPAPPLPDQQRLFFRSSDSNSKAISSDKAFMPKHHHFVTHCGFFFPQHVAQFLFIGL